MAHVLFFLLLLIVCCSYALWRGGAPERLAAGSEIVAVFLTAAIQSRSEHHYVDFAFGVFLVDLALLIGLGIIALHSDRFWPMWATGFQVADIIVHLCKAFAPALLPLGYSVGLSAWGYPKLVLFALGAMRHRSRLRLYGSDPPWSRPR
jgi:hypothetical protein